MAHNLLRVTLSQVARSKIVFISRCNVATSSLLLSSKPEEYEKIGNRDIVGFGFNGQASYMDRYDFPMPAVRFKENTPDVLKLREKEKGDWKNLSIDEKKALYRASFCLTFAELDAPTGNWKYYIAGILTIVSCAFWIVITMKKFIYPPPIKTMSEEWKEAALKRMITLEVNPIQGISSKWDYDNDRWKD